MEKLRISGSGNLIARRRLLQAFAATGGAISASFLLNRPVPGGVLMSDEKLVPAKAAVDHLIFGASDLDQAIAWFEKTAGVKPVIGGVHPGRGTRNALVSLGGRQYLEIIAPDPAQQVASLPYDLKSMSTPRMVHWAAVTNNISLIAQKANLSVSNSRDGSRARPDGRVLKWRTLDIQNRMGEIRFSPIPFFIEWASDSPHPSQDSPKGCKLQSFEMEHPDPESVIEALKRLGIEAKVKQAAESKLIAILKAPKGEVRLS